MARSIGIDQAHVLAVAAELADMHGLDRLTLAQVASRLGMKLPSLYNHVDGLAGLRHELALLGMRQLLEQMRTAVIGKAEDTAVLALAHAYRSYVAQHPGVYAATIRAPNPDDLQLNQLSTAIIQVALAVLAPYHLSEPAMIHAVRGLRSIVHGFASLEQAGGFGIPLDRNASFDWLLGTYITGLRTGGTR